MNKGKVLAGQLIFVAICLFVLETAVRVKWISPIFLTKPSSIFLTIWTESTVGELLHFVLLSLYEVAITLLVAATIGLFIGYVLWSFPRLGEAYETLLAAIFASPIILLYPVFLVLFGRTSNAIVAQAAIYGILPIILNTRRGLIEVSPTMVKVGKSMNLSEGQIFRKILLPAASPTIFTGFRVGFIYMLISVFAMEYLVTMGGLGKVISLAYDRFNTAELYAGIAGIILLCIAFIWVFNWSEARIRR